jgi:CD63 antigen
MAKGSLGCGLQTMKTFLFVVNLIFFLVGLGLIGAGSYVAATLSDFEGAFSEGFTFAIGIPVVAITLGVFVLIGSAMGCIGAIKENTCLIKTFLVFLTIVILAEIGVAVTVILYNEDPTIKSNINGYMEEKLTKCQLVKDGIVTDECKFLLPIQDIAECCGYSDAILPLKVEWEASCIGEDAAGIEVARKNARGFCNQRIVNFISDNLAIVAGVLGGIFFAEVVLMVGTCCLIRGINSDNKYA